MPMRVSCRFVWLLSLTLAFIALVLTPPAETSSVRDRVFTRPPIDLSPFLCGGLGQACCRPPRSITTAGYGHLVACGTGLGCDVTSNTCVQPCGGTGQVCCDGPETRAPKWTNDGRVYSPNYFGMREMCDRGACDIPSHRCFDCGTVDGAPCCPPDAAQATARCIVPQPALRVQ